MAKILLKKTKKIFTVAISLLFVLSIGYFAVLPPTSAWFYQSLLTDNNRIFVFGTLSGSQTFTGEDDLVLPAATKLESSGGETLFDDVLHIVSITAVNNNSSTIPARVYLTVSPTSGNLDGLRYFFYSADEKVTTVKDLIANKDIIKNSANDTLTALNNYNNGDGTIGNEGRYVLIQSGETKILKIAFWADYNVVGSTLNVAGIAQINYNVNITLSAVQDTDGAFTR